MTSARIITAPSYQKILKAASGLFAERGFKGTTTAEIAKRAKVNEALIYRYFPAKCDLYAAIMHDKIESPACVDLIDAAEDHALSPEAYLRAVADGMVKSAVNDPTFLRLYYFSALEGHPLSKMFYENFVCRLRKLVSARIRKAVKDGTFRKVNADVTAAAFIGTIRNYILNNELFDETTLGGKHCCVTSDFVDIFLGGLCAKKNHSR